MDELSLIFGITGLYDKMVRPLPTLALVGVSASIEN
jgi:hypothetical protein